MVLPEDSFSERPQACYDGDSSSHQTAAVAEEAAPASPKGAADSYLSFTVEGSVDGEHVIYKAIDASGLVISTLKKQGCVQSHLLKSSIYTLMWTGNVLKNHCFRTLLPFQRVNHFPRTHELTRKDKLYRNIQRMQRRCGTEKFDFIPEFYVIPHDYNKIKEKLTNSKEPWIVKPVGLSRGRGISIITKPEEIPNGTTIDDELIISRYIQDPYVFNGHKFDLRLYVAVTSFHPLVAYLFEDGLVRFAAEPYSLADFGNRYVHLTNYSVNKDNENYISNNDLENESVGHKWTLGSLLRSLKAQGYDPRLFMIKVEDLIVKTLLSAQSPIAAAYSSVVPYEGNCFEIYGFDIMFDSALKPWLLEVNLSPSLSCSAPIDAKVKCHVLCDLFNLANINAEKTAVLRFGDKLKSVGTSVLDYGKKQYKIYTDEPDKLSVNPTKNHPLGLKTISRDQRVRIIADRIKAAEKKLGGFLRIHPTVDSSCFYSEYYEDSLEPCDALLHALLYPNDGPAINASLFHQFKYNLLESDGQHTLTAGHLACELIADTVQRVDRYATIKPWFQKPVSSYFVFRTTKKRALSSQERHTANQRRPKTRVATSDVDCPDAQVCVDGRQRGGGFAGDAVAAASLKAITEQVLLAGSDVPSLLLNAASSASLNSVVSSGAREFLGLTA